jgi:hypothetical protein
MQPSPTYCSQSGDVLTLWDDLGYAVLGAFFLILFMIIHPGVTSLAVFCIVAVCLALSGGEVWVFNMRLNAISSVNAIMSVGLTIDYVVSGGGG